MAKLTSKVGLSLPFWGAALKAWAPITQYLTRPRDTLSTEEVLCEPLAQADLWVHGFLPYRQALRKYNWHSLSDLWNPDKGQPWSDAEAEAAGWLPGNSGANLPDRWLHFPFEWRTWVMNPNPAPLSPRDWVATLYWEDDNPSISQVELVSNGTRSSGWYNGQANVLWFHWSLDLEETGLVIDRRSFMREGQWAPADTMLRLAVWQPRKNSPYFWSPGLSEDAELNLNNWQLARPGQKKGIPLTRAQGRHLYR